MTDISADGNGVVTSNGAWSRGEWVGGSQERSSSLDGVGSLPDHGTDWARVHVLDETGEKWLRREVLVVLLQVSLARSAELKGGELVTLLLESGDDLSDESTLDTVWFDGDAIRL